MVLGGGIDSRDASEHEQSGDSQRATIFSRRFVPPRLYRYPRPNQRDLQPVGRCRAGSRNFDFCGAGGVVDVGTAGEGAGEVGGAAFNEPPDFDFANAVSIASM